MQKPLYLYSIEDLRLMIGQEFGLEYLIPLAIDELKNNLFAEGDFYEGDLLARVLDIDADFWKQNKNYWTIINGLISERNDEMIENKISSAKFETL